MRSPAARADMRLTYDDFVRFPDDGKRHEIIDGEHVVTPSPNVRHQVLVLRLALSAGLDAGTTGDRYQVVVHVEGADTGVRSAEVVMDVLYERVAAGPAPRQELGS